MPPLGWVKHVSQDKCFARLVKRVIYKTQSHQLKRLADESSPHTLVYSVSRSLNPSNSLSFVTRIHAISVII